MAGDGVRHVSDDERRARIAARHGIAPDARYADPVAATEAMTVLHATEPATVYLSLHARVDDLTVADVDRAFYDERSLVKQLAMRRTSSSSRATCCPPPGAARPPGSPPSSGPGWPRTSSPVGSPTDGAAWVDRACAAVLARLADGSELSAKELREQLPELEGRIDVAVGKPYGANVAMSPRVLTQLGVEGLVTRGRNGGHWRISRPQWTSMAAWLGEVPEPMKAAEGWAELVRRWLRDVRSRHRRRHPVVARRHRRHRQAGAGRRGRRAGLPRRRRHGLAPAARPRAGHPRRVVGGAAARARPDGDGLEVPRLLPRRRPRAAPVRQQRERRHHRVGRRTRGGLLGAGRRRRRRPPLRRAPCRRLPSAPSPSRRRG